MINILTISFFLRVTIPYFIRFVFSEELFYFLIIPFFFILTFRCDMGNLLSFWVTSPSWDSDLSHKKLCEEKLLLKTMVFRSWAHIYLSFLVPKRSSCILIFNLCTCTLSFYLLKDCIPPTPSLLNKEIHIVPVPVSDSAVWVRAYRPKQKLNGPFSRQQFHVSNCLHTKTQ